ncbi:protein toll-like [Spodoptera litura]|uniref:Protein toll-like n=1 Tax=Spodoptera litura TaxID=69820 RepID=A0A9J7ISJ0_SPOLT|nr:protein toll-like [Spodoptera litura]
MARWVLVLALIEEWWAPAQLVARWAPVQFELHCAVLGRCSFHGCFVSSCGNDEYIYIVDGLKVLIEYKRESLPLAVYTDSGYFNLECPEGLTLDNSALPSFKSQLRVNKVRFKHCPPPQSSYADVLERFNVVVLDSLVLTQAGNLTAIHFAQLQHLPRLELLTAALAPGALSALSQLRFLQLDRVRTAPSELRRLPASLETLSLTRMGMNVTAADLAALPRLADLLVRDSANVHVEAGGALRVLVLELPSALLVRELPPTLRKLMAAGWSETHPTPWLQCALKVLDLRDVAAEELPTGWLARCAALRSLHVITAARLSRLEPGVLRGAVLLRELRVVRTALQYLPPGLLDDVPQLKLLDLSSNHLLELPGILFAKTNSLESLNLSWNRFTQNVLSSLSTITSLVCLDLSYNNLNDFCSRKSKAVPGSSPLQYLKQLRSLKLANTSISMICRDWRENMTNLETIDLTHNLFEYITFADMQFYGRVDVDLQRNNVSTLHYTRHDYERAVSPHEPPLLTRLHLSSVLRCDCHVYWAARAFHERPAHAPLEPRCLGGGLLGSMLDALQCTGAPPGVSCDAPCACAWRPGNRTVLRVRCEAVGLRSVRVAVAAVRVPRGLTVDWELYLAHNHIDHVVLEDMPHNLTATRSPATATPPTHSPCSLDTACTHWWAPALGAAAALATLLLCALLFAALWRQPGLRLRLKVMRQRRGWLPELEDDARCFDVFVSFSHGDEQFVRSQLVARLESGPTPYRLCLHYRDWAPGGWIPAQIAASVRASRRTVAVVSEHFLRSSWARAEFQEAHALALRDARPRLVVVLMEEPSKLPLDDRLRRYLATNTYVRWGDPWFWEKLYLALPCGREPAPPSACSALSPATTDASGASPALSKSSVALNGDDSTLVPQTPARGSTSCSSALPVCNRLAVQIF